MDMTEKREMTTEEKAMWNEYRRNNNLRIEVWNDDVCLSRVPMRYIPIGAKYRECYETDTEYIICGQPADDDTDHNCDALGCTSVNHVLARFSKQEQP